MLDDGSVKLLETPPPVSKQGYVIVETLYSVISIGTEKSLTSFGGKNLIQKALERPDQVRKVWEKINTDGLASTLESAFAKLKEPMPLGYSGVGKVIECGPGVEGIYPGDHVAMAGQAFHSEMNRVNKNLVARIPEKVTDLRQAAFCALGGIALQGIRQAKVEQGECVAVIGLGLLGHITARILDAYGCDVIGYDIAPEKALAYTKLKAFVNSGDENAVETTKSLTRGRGVDKIIITAATNSNGPMDLAAAIARDRASICMIGVTQMNIDRRPFYEKELSFTIARSYGPGRYDTYYEEKGIDYPIGYVRFTEGRNIEEFIRLLAEKKLSLADLITHEYDFSEAPKAYEALNQKAAQSMNFIGVLLKYAANTEKLSHSIRNSTRVCCKGDQSAISIGLIGAGNFSRNTMLPVMKKTGRFRFVGLATTGGVAAAQANHIFPFQYITNNYKDLLQDEDIDLIVVSTQHGMHAQMVIEALRAGKNVYCEKPLCLSETDLNEIEHAYLQSTKQLFCGLNRRHAPMIKKIRQQQMTHEFPAVYNYIVNAGEIAPQHWTQDISSGGGRIIGEACHFIDVIQFLDGSRLDKISITYAKNNSFPCHDNCILVLHFSSGAVGNVIYTAMGSKNYSKEQLRVFSNGMVMEMDNFIKLRQYSGKSANTTRSWHQDKGFYDEYTYIFNVLTGKEKNSSIEDAIWGHRLLLEAVRKSAINA